MWISQHQKKARNHPVAKNQNLNLFKKENMHIREALQLVCGDICLQVNSVIPGATQGVQVVPGKIEDGAHATWLAKGTHLFTLIKCGMMTVVYCHENKTMFYANQNFMLKKDAPDGHAFLAQIVEDREANGLTPRLLIMDLVCPKVSLD